MLLMTGFLRTGINKPERQFPYPFLKANPILQPIFKIRSHMVALLLAEGFFILIFAA